MSFHMHCDICGKDSNLGKAVFNIDPIELVIENYKGEKFKAFCTMGIQNLEDHTFLESIKESTDKELNELSKRDDLHINVPEPHVCIACQKSLAKRVLEEGFIDEDRVYTPKSKVSLQQFMAPPTNPLMDIIGGMGGSNIQLLNLDEFSDIDFMDEDDDEDYDDEDYEDEDYEE